jgi:hypothetical protein
MMGAGGATDPAPGGIVAVAYTPAASGGRLEKVTTSDGRAVWVVKQR